MRKIVKIAAILLATMYSSRGTAASDVDLQSLRSAVIEMCRGGTLTGSVTLIEEKARKTIVTIKNPFEDQTNVEVVLSAEEWNGMQALQNPEQYSKCVPHTLDLLVRALKVKQNIDKDLNARMEYIRSPVFCERLRYVVLQAPFEFIEWRRGPGKNEGDIVDWLIGPFIMGNPEALDFIIGNPEALEMKQEGKLLNTDALIRRDKKGPIIYFYEPLVLTHQFSANAETGFIMDQIKRVIDECFTSKVFPSVEKVRFKGGPYFYNSGMPYWKFDKIRVNGKTLPFVANLRTLEFDDLGYISHIIYVTVHAPYE